MQGCRAAQKDVADTGGCPPSRCPLAFNNSTETQNATWSPPAAGSQWEDVALDSQLLRATIKEERLLLYWFSPNWS